MRGGLGVESEGFPERGSPLPHSPVLAAKVRWRLALPCVLFMLLSSLDRANLGLAALQMNAELGLRPSEYGLGAGIVFVGFLAGQYPSVLCYLRLGMRRWLCGCALLWGASAAAVAFIHTPAELYSLRILLGLAEGGLAPGIVLYLSQFSPPQERATTFTLPMLAIPLSVIVGGPLSGWLMEQPLAGMAGWRWMLLAEALPTVLLGLAALAYFPDRPEQARWLTASERQALASTASRADATNWSGLRQYEVWVCALLWFCLLSGSYGIIFWLPQIVHALTVLGTMAIGLIGALPWVGALLGMYGNARHSDLTEERFWHVGLPAAVAALALLSAWLAGVGTLALVALAVGGVGLGAAQGAFWALPTRLLSTAALPMAVVTVNIAGSAGGLVMPHLLGWARQSSGSFALPMLLMVAILLVAAFLVVLLRWISSERLTQIVAAP